MLKVASHGDMVDVSLGGLRFVYVFKPEYIEHILLKWQQLPKRKLMERTELCLERPRHRRR